MLSVIVSVKNQLQYTRKLVHDLFITTHNDFNLIVINNGSSDGTGKFLDGLAKEFDNVTVINEDKPNNIAHLWNLGLNKVKDGYIVICNNDILLPVNWDVKMIKCFEHYRDCGICVPVSNYASKAQKPVSEHKLCADTFDTVVEELENKGKWVDLRNTASGFFMLFKKELIDDIGQFCEKFDIGMYEDNVFFRRTLKKNYKVIMDGKTYIYHYGSQTFRSEKISSSRLFKENRVKFNKMCQDGEC